MSGFSESMQWNACVCRPDLRLYSHLKEVLGYGIRIHVNSVGKIPNTKRGSISMSLSRGGHLTIRSQRWLSLPMRSHHMLQIQPFFFLFVSGGAPGGGKEERMRKKVCIGYQLH